MKIISSEFKAVLGYIAGFVALAISVLLFIPTLGWSWHWAKRVAQFTNDIDWTNWTGID